MLNFKNLKQLEQNLRTQEDCITYFENIRWVEGKYCPHCNSTKFYTLKKAYQHKCANKDCKKYFNVLSKTVFENTKIPLTTWFTAIYIATSHKKGISSHQLSRDLGITQKTAWFVLHRIREMLQEKAPVMLANEVEIDETFIGGKEKNKHKKKRISGTQGRSVKTKTPVLGIVERGGKVYALPVIDTKADTLTPIMVEIVHPDSIVYTDEWHGYRKLHKHFSHSVIRHSAGEYKNGNTHTNTIEGFWALLKRGIYGIYHHASDKHLHRYCNEFAFRYNTREQKENQRFDNALAISGKRLTYNELTGAQK